MTVERFVFGTSKDHLLSKQSSGTQTFVLQFNFALLIHKKEVGNLHQEVWTKRLPVKTFQPGNCITVLIYKMVNLPLVVSITHLLFILLHILLLEIFLRLEREIIRSASFDFRKRVLYCFVKLNLILLLLFNLLL